MNIQEKWFLDIKPTSDKDVMNIVEMKTNDL